VREEDTVRALESEGTLANRLDELVQRAQVLRGELDPSYERFDDVEYLRGSGNGILPDDDPHPRLPDQACERNELIRVYLYVQLDHVRDRLALLAGRVDCDKASTRELVEFSETLPTDQEDSRDVEANLLETFFERLFEAIQETAREIGRDPEEGYVHLYTYSGQERDALMEAVQRQPAVFGSGAVRDLLGLREGIEQPMVSVDKSELASCRHCTRQREYAGTLQRRKQPLRDVSRPPRQHCGLREYPTPPNSSSPYAAVWPMPTSS